MKASVVILLSGVALAVSACATTKNPPSQDPRSQAQRAADCVARFEPPTAPQIMTYDSKTGTEVHVNSDGRQVDVTAQNASDNTALGMGGKVGGAKPKVCTDELPGGEQTPPPAN